VITRRDGDAVAPDEPLLLGRLAEPLSENGLYQAMCRAYRRGNGIGRFGLHRLRHFFGTETRRRGMLLVVAKELMGHEDIKTTSGYSHVTPDEAKSAHARATPLHALPPARRRRLG
jgi:site-specific recombinase XerD